MRAFMTDYVYPAADKNKEQVQASSEKRWEVPPIFEELKARAYSEGLWNLFLPPSEHDDDDGNRYTSYQTAIEFHGGCGADEYKLELSALPSGTPLSLYLLIPYCQSIC